MSVLVSLLVRVFGRKFYRVNSTFLLYATILLFSYGVFVKTAGHIDPEIHRYAVFSLLLTFIESPVFAVAIYFLWLVYTWKSWKFIFDESNRDEYLFLRYSTTAMSRSVQFTAWCLYQLYIFIPLIVYWLLVAIYAITITEFRVLFATTMVIFILTLISAWVYVYRFNHHRYGSGNAGSIQRLVMAWKKPVFSVAVLDVFLRGTSTFLLVKGISVSLLVLSVVFLSDVDKPWMVAYLMAAAMALAHSILGYWQHLFQERHLYFLQLLPLTRWRVYAGMLLGQFILLLPEAVALFVFFETQVALLALFILLGGALVTRTNAYLSGTAPWPYIRYNFTWFTAATVIILYEYVIWLIISQFIVSYAIFYFCYFKRKEIYLK